MQNMLSYGGKKTLKNGVLNAYVSRARLSWVDVDDVADAYCRRVDVSRTVDDCCPGIVLQSRSLTLEPPSPRNGSPTEGCAEPTVGSSVISLLLD